MIVVIDYRTANIGSILNMFKRVGLDARVAQTPAELDGASQLVLPGIGHFDTCARNLRTAGFATALEEPVLGQGIPLLGICVGAQLLTDGSDEGDEPGLGWIRGRTRAFPKPVADEYRIPHMGWNHVRSTRPHALLDGYVQTPRFYFVHSYYLSCADEADVLATTHHGIEFASAIGRRNISGVQFHPEKSHKYGMRLFENFGRADA